MCMYKHIYYISASIKSIEDIAVGDTVYDIDNPTDKTLNEIVSISENGYYFEYGCDYTKVNINEFKEIKDE